MNILKLTLRVATRQLWAGRIGEAYPISTENRSRFWIVIGEPEPPRSRDEKVGINQDISRFIPTNLAKKIGKSQDISRFSPTLGSKIGKSWGYPDSPRLKTENRGESRYIPTLPESPRNFKQSGRPPRSRSRPVPTRFLSGFYPPRDISPIVATRDFKNRHVFTDL